eukprot:s2904_g5.t1
MTYDDDDVGFYGGGDDEDDDDDDDNNDGDDDDDDGDDDDDDGDATVRRARRRVLLSSFTTHAIGNRELVDDQWVVPSMEQLRCPTYVLMFLQWHGDSEHGTTTEMCDGSNSSRRKCHLPFWKGAVLKRAWRRAECNVRRIPRSAPGTQQSKYLCGVSPRPSWWLQSQGSTAHAETFERTH